MADSLKLSLSIATNFLREKKVNPLWTLEKGLAIVQALKPVNMIIGSIDVDDTVCKTLKWVHGMYKQRYNEIMFCNGGDRIRRHKYPRA